MSKRSKKKWKGPRGFKTSNDRPTKSTRPQKQPRSTPLRR